MLEMWKKLDSKNNKEKTQEDKHKRRETQDEEHKHKNKNSTTIETVEKVDVDVKLEKFRQEDKKLDSFTTGRKCSFEYKQHKNKIYSNTETQEDARPGFLTRTQNTRQEHDHTANKKRKTSPVEMPENGKKGKGTRNFKELARKDNNTRIVNNMEKGGAQASKKGDLYAYFNLKPAFTSIPAEGGIAGVRGGLPRQPHGGVGGGVRDGGVPSNSAPVLVAEEPNTRAKCSQLGGARILSESWNTQQQQQLNSLKLSGGLFGGKN